MSECECESHGHGGFVVGLDVDFELKDEFSVYRDLTEYGMSPVCAACGGRIVDLGRFMEPEVDIEDVAEGRSGHGFIEEGLLNGMD